MKKVIVTFLFMVFTLTGNAADRIVGKWKTIDDETKKPKSIVEIYEQNGVYYGKVVKLFNAPQDKKCTKCKGVRKDKPIVGMTIVWNMKKDDDEYSGGEILDPKKGKSYSCKMWVEVDKLKVRGYIAFFYRTQYWYRVK